MKHIIVGTAGHIDHGKTALVRALTGVNTDRLKEEQQRGITIDLGFAMLQLSETIQAGIIDVPGHEKFVKNMLAGVGGIDVAILVVAADEGIMPQTEEHVAICDLLQIQRGLIALTKIDLVDDEWREMVLDDLRTGLAGTFLAAAPIIPVSAKTGAGLDLLLQALTDIAAQIAPRPADGIFRLPIDRVFTIKGFGTVVTGTLIAGSVAVEDPVQLLPAGLITRARNVQVHDLPVTRASAGQRTALNLHGMEKAAIQRGDVICTPDTLRPTYMLDALLTLTVKTPAPLEYRSRVRLHHGTSEIMARVVFLDRDALLPGESAYVQFHLEAPLVAMARDRYIIRSYSPMVTIGGGEILDVQPQKHKRSPEIVQRLEILKHGTLAELVNIYVADAGVSPVTAKMLAGRIAVPVSELQLSLAELITQRAVIPIKAQADAVLHATHYQELAQEIGRLVAAFHTQFPLKSGMSKEELRKKLPAALPLTVFQQVLDDEQQAGRLQIEQNSVRRPAHQLRLTPAQERIRQRLAEIYRTARFQPPNRKDALAELAVPEKESQAILALLTEQGLLIRVEEEIYYHQEVLDEITQKIIQFLTQHHEMAIGDLKELFQVSRKYSVPLLAYCDAQGLTIRKGDVRMLRRAG